MNLVDKIMSINRALQGSMEARGMSAIGADEAAEVVYREGIISPEDGPPGARGFAFRQFLRNTRDRLGYDVLGRLLGVTQAEDQPHHKYTVHRFNAPTREQVVELVKNLPAAMWADDETGERTEGLPDYLAPDLDVVFVGTSVGDESAKRRHYYAHDKNRFWDLVTESGLVSDIVGSENDHLVLEDKCGLTDLVKQKVSSSDTKLDKSDFDTAGFRDKIREYQPKVVAFNGKRAYKEATGVNPSDYGLAGGDIEGSFVFVLPSSSGSDTNLTYPQKLGWYKKLKDFLRTL